MAGYDALIRFWIHEEPAADLDRWLEQSADALNFEERFFKSLGNAVAKAFSGTK